MSQLQIAEAQTSKSGLIPSRTYAASVAAILTKALAGSPSMLPSDEFKFVIAAWTEVLEGCVPESRLNDCYLRARRQHKSTFPLDVSELCQQWREIEVEAANSLQGATLNKKVCKACDDKLEIEIFSPKDGRDVLAACPFHPRAGGLQ